MKHYKFLLTALLAMTSVAAFAWGQKGHDVTTALAERHLTAATKATIDDLLDGKSIVYWSNWLDNASHTPEYEYSKTWHYKNIDANQAYDQVSPFPQGDVVVAIGEQIKILQNANASKEEKSLALKMLVHLLGDIHQPMHMGHQTDLGGNRVYVKFFNNNTNLHSVWDSSLPEAGHKWSYTEWVDQIDRATDEQRAVILQGNQNDWGRETYSICSLIYNETPADTKISYDYIARWTPVVEDQLLKAGLRLADVLNGIFDPAYTPATTAVSK